MKLLLTSGGITNKSIANALIELVGKKPEDISVAFIPTAANVDPDDKDWLIDDLVSLKKQKFSVDIVDISAIDKELWLPRMEKADTLFFEGGNVYHLMEWVNKSGLAEILPELLKNKVYVGVSAGSMIISKDILLKISQIIYEEGMEKTADMKSLGFVDFQILPHFNSTWFERVRKENIEIVAKDMKETIYVLDDNSALKVVDGKVEVISEGEYLIFNE